MQSLFKCSLAFTYPGQCHCLVIIQWFEVVARVHTLKYMIHCGTLLLCSIINANIFLLLRMFAEAEVAAPLQAQLQQAAAHITALQAQLQQAVTAQITAEAAERQVKGEKEVLQAQLRGVMNEANMLCAQLQELRGTYAAR